MIDGHVTCSVARVYRGVSRSAYWKPDEAGSHLDRRVLDKPVEYDKMLRKIASFVTLGVEGGTGPLCSCKRQTQDDPPN
jgi:hypothetical protein